MVQTVCRRLEFQSTHPYGVGLRPAFLKINSMFISIHPPVWGGTLIGCRLRNTALFQSTHPYGVGPKSFLGIAQAMAISIHPPVWGGTFPWGSFVYHFVYFNPPTRMGWDAEYWCLLGWLRYFNPPTRMGWDNDVHGEQVR